jgi:tetratricopeptide (TPR) repeat protein
MQGAAAIPAPLKEIIQKCLEKKPERRYQRPEELLAAILKARESLEPESSPGSPAAPAPPPSKVSGRTWRSSVRNAALIGIMLAGIACVLLALRHYGAAPAAPAPAVAADIDLLLGLGDFDTALDVARKRWGEQSPEYRAVLARLEESRRAAAELKARSAIARHDWVDAESALGRAVVGGEPVHRRELLSVLQLCRELAQAQQLEKTGRIDEAIQMYQGAAEKAPTFDGYCRDSIARLKAIRASLPHSK